MKKQQNKVVNIQINEISYAKDLVSLELIKYLKV